MTGPVLHASYWGRLWRVDPARKGWAAAASQALSEAAITAGGVLQQSSFYADDDWREAITGASLDPALILDGVQTLIERDVIPAVTNLGDVGGDKATHLIIFPDETLRAVDTTARVSDVGNFRPLEIGERTLRYAIATRPPAHARGDAGDLARRWSGVLDEEASRGAYTVGKTGRDVESQRLKTLPPAYVVKQIPKFGFDNTEMARWIEELALPETTASVVALRRSAFIIEARLRALMSARVPAPATPEELQSFDRFLPSLTNAERFEAMGAVLGRDHSDVALVRAILADASEPALARIRAANDGVVGPFKFTDVVFWTYQNLLRARALGLESGPRRSILDIGCGGGHFANVCRYFGHEVIGVDLENDMYADIAAALGVDRVIAPVLASQPMPNLGRRFDVVVALHTEFNCHFPRTETAAFWELEHWRFFFNDLIERQFNFPARIYIALNEEIHSGHAAMNQDLLALCVRHGADVDEATGVIDWFLERPVRLD